MSTFRKFMMVWFSTVIIGTILMAGALKAFGPHPTQIEQGAPTEGSNHFSVVWRGFLPEYDPSYPDYYICINELVGPTLTMNIKLFIFNQEANGYYFKVKSCDAGPPSGWYVPQYLVGYIDIDESKTFVYQMERTKPASIPQGRLTENVCLNVTAYRDATYTNLYSWDSFNCTFHLLDRNDDDWTLVYNNNFDDGTAQGWSGGTPTTTYYRSFRYSLRGSDFYKSFYVGAEYNESYIIFAVRSDNVRDDYPMIYLDGTLYFKPDATPSANIWYQFAIPLHLGTTTIRSYFYYASYMDDVHVIAK